IASSTTGRAGPSRKRPSSAVVSRKRVTARARGSSAAHLAHETVQPRAGPHRHDEVRVGAVVAPGEDHLAPGGEVLEGEPAVDRFERAELRHGPPVDGDHDALAGLRPAEHRGHVPAEVPHADPFHLAEATGTVRCRCTPVYTCRLVRGSGTK